MSQKKGKRPSPSATTRSTAGPGYEFEDLVGADLLSHLLLDMPVQGIGVPGVRVLHQVRALGWAIDDLACIGHDDKGRQCTLALSCKSSSQVSVNGLPADFVSAAWSVWRKGTAFSRDTDHIALVTRGRHAQFEPLWHDLKTWCLGGDCALALARINDSARHRRVFDSVLQPGAIEGALPQEEEAIALLNRLHVVPTDFQLSPSQSIANGKLRCQMALVSDSPADGALLWETLVQKAENARLGNGTTELPGLLATIQERFSLRAHPSISAAWRSLQRFSETHRATIETELPGGKRLDRPLERGQLSDAISGQFACVVVGESGVGKSALVKSFLDADTSTPAQIWMGPESLAEALDEASQLVLGVDHPLPDLLARAPGTRKVLVLDSVERMSAASISRVKRLLEILEARRAIGDLSWQVIAVTQESGVGLLAGTSVTAKFWPRVVIQSLSNEAIRTALQAVPTLRWIANQDDILSLFANLRTLGWVMAEAASFAEENSKELTSIATVADRLWSRWTEGRAQLQRLMIRLAERDAAFERSFAVSEMEGGDAAAFDSRPSQAPLLRNARNRIEFQHDLASDWVRYQRLKEIADDVSRWLALASQPLWINALRLFGQYLLLERDQSRYGWDRAFTLATSGGHIEAADLLLDALCLDPHLDSHLQQRDSLFFANDGELLIRLLHRFLLSSTTPDVPKAIPVDSGMRIYLEASMRVPVYGQWFPMARFLSRNSERVSALGASIVSKLSSLWLSKTPTHIDDRPMPLRDVFSHLALETARIRQIKGAAYSGIGRAAASKEIFVAALAGAHEIPDAVANFALEMAQRRPLNKQSQDRVNQLREVEFAKRAAAQKDREKGSRRALPTPTFIPSRRALPPWPLGAMVRVDDAFREAVLHSGALTPLMTAATEAAREVLLACIIEDSPEEEYGGSSRIDNSLGIEFDQDSYPTIFWKSPFYVYLQSNPDAAMEGIRKLLLFVMERWASQAPEGAEIPSVKVTSYDGGVYSFPGGPYQFGWSQHNSTSSGQLFCALDALEKWIVERIDAGMDVSPWCERLLAMQTSVALLGVLVNVGKYKPSLFHGALSPLLQIEMMYWWDDNRAKATDYNFDSLNWYRKGEIAFNLARDWVLADHRQQSLRRIASRLVEDDPALASTIKGAFTTWEVPEDEGEALRQRVLQAELDPINREWTTGEDGEARVSKIIYPDDLQSAAIAYRERMAESRPQVLVPNLCMNILAGRVALTEEMAVSLASGLPQTDEALPDSDQERTAVAASAAALIVKGGAWLNSHPEIRNRAENALRSQISEAVDEFTDTKKFRSHSTSEALQFAAIGVLHAALTSEEPDRWNGPLIGLLSGPDVGAVATLMREAERFRDRLGSTWYRMLFLVILSAGLDQLRPQWDDEGGDGARWRAWVKRLQSKAVFGVEQELECLDPCEIAHRVERLLILRQMRSDSADQGWRGRWAREARTGGLSIWRLNSALSWLIDPDRAGSNFKERENQILLRRFWDYEAWRMIREGNADEGDGKYALPSNLGYSMLQVAPHAVLASSVDEAPQIWRPILDLGPAGHAAISHFLGGWFLMLYKAPDANRFLSEWRAMIQAALDANWRSGRNWHYGRTMLAEMLGLRATSQLEHAGEVRHRMQELLPFYTRWARENLAQDEDSLTDLGRFLASNPGRPFRLEGLLWIGSAISTFDRIYRPETGNALAEAMDAILVDHAEDLTSNQTTRDSMISTVAWLVRNRVGAAMGLQARIAVLR